MRKIPVGLLALALGGCASLGQLDGFSELAEQSEVVDVVGVGWGRSGDFTLAPLGTNGTFKRSADSSGRNGLNFAKGQLRFALGGTGEFAGLKAECAHSRETYDTIEEVSRKVTVETREVTEPFYLTCGYFRGEDAIGGLEIREEVAQAALDGRVLRSGRADVGEARLRLTSQHRMAQTGLESDTPLGYAMDYRDGGEAMIFANGATKRIALPREGRDQRAAALLSGIALALVWDPGDGD